MWRSGRIWPHAAQSLFAGLVTLSQALTELRRLNEPVPDPLRLPTPAEVEAAEREAGVTLPSDLRRYLLEASDIVLGALEPVTAVPRSGHTYLPHVVEGARSLGVPDDLVPVCEDNSDFYCLAPSGEVVFWSHDGATDERWTSLAAWIEEVWIGEG